VNETLEKNSELTVESKLENLTRIAEFITQTMENYGIHNMKDIYAVQLSVDEAATNIIQHAYPNQNGGPIEITCMLSDSGSEFTVNITDWGRPFDPTGAPTPDTQSGINERKVGGLGITFMKKFMDTVKYERIKDKNLLILVKHIAK
jgi:serine/threonine-protein kinase RsbW